MPHTTKRVHFEQAKGGGFIVRSTREKGGKYHEDVEIAKTFKEAMTKARKQFNKDTKDV